MTQASLYEQVGGLPFFERLVDRFYDGVEADDVLLPLYPDRSDLVGARRRLALFLVQYWAARRPTWRSVATRGSGRGTSRSRSDRSSATAGSSTCARPSTRPMRPSRREARLHEYMTMAADAMRNREERA